MTRCEAIIGMSYPKLEHRLALGPGQFVTFAQTVGYPRA